MCPCCVTADECILRLVPKSNTVPRVVRSRLADAIGDARKHREDVNDILQIGLIACAV